MSTCEIYKLNNGAWQCGNCGAVFKIPSLIVAEDGPNISTYQGCPKCRAQIISEVDEGETEDAEVETW